MRPQAARVHRNAGRLEPAGDDGRAQLGLDHVQRRAQLRIAHQAHTGTRRVVRQHRASGLGRGRIRGFRARPLHRLARCRLDLGQREPARAQQHRVPARTVNDGGLDAHLTRPTIEHPDLVQSGATPLELLTHMLRGGGADAPKAVGAWRGHAQDAVLRTGIEQLARHRVRRAAQADGVMPPSGGRGHARIAGHDHRQRAGPEGLRQTLRHRRERRDEMQRRLRVGHMHDQRVIGRTALGGKDACHRRVVVGTRTEAINGLGRQGQQAPVGKALGGPLDRVRLGGGVEHGHGRVL